MAIIKNTLKIIIRDITFKILNKKIKNDKITMNFKKNDKITMNLKLMEEKIKNINLDKNEIEILPNPFTYEFIKLMEKGLPDGQ